MNHGVGICQATQKAIYALIKCNSIIFIVHFIKYYYHYLNRQPTKSWLFLRPRLLYWLNHLFSTSLCQPTNNHLLPPFATYKWKFLELPLETCWQILNAQKARPPNEFKNGASLLLLLCGFKVLINMTAHITPKHFPSIWYAVASIPL